MKTYLEFCALITLWVLAFMFVLPWAFSADNWMGVCFGFILFLATIPVLFVLVKRIWLSPSIQAFVKKVSK